MSRFPTAGHLVSWAGLAPRLDESAGAALNPNRHEYKVHRNLPPLAATQHCHERHNSRSTRYEIEWAARSDSPDKIATDGPAQPEWITRAFIDEIRGDSPPTTSSTVRGEQFIFWR